jgi:hypothetical protein
VETVKLGRLCNNVDIVCEDDQECVVDLGGPKGGAAVRICQRRRCALNDGSNSGPFCPKNTVCVPSKADIDGNPLPDSDNRCHKLSDVKACDPGIVGVCGKGKTCGFDLSADPDTDDVPTFCVDTAADQ